MSQSASESVDKWVEFLAAECDGSGEHSIRPGVEFAEVRRLDTGGGGGVRLCFPCWVREINWRAERNQHVASPFALPGWEELPVVARIEVRP